MSIEQSLFGDDEAPRVQANEAPPQAAPATQWQIDLIRRALVAQGITAMDMRQSLVEAAVARPVASLRDLTSQEAIGVLARLDESAPRRETSSSWDARDEDTWIDKL